MSSRGCNKRRPTQCAARSMNHISVLLCCFCDIYKSFGSFRIKREVLFQQLRDPDCHSLQFLNKIVVRESCVHDSLYSRQFRTLIQKRTPWCLSCKVHIDIGNLIGARKNVQCRPYHRSFTPNSANCCFAVCCLISLRCVSACWAIRVSSAIDP
jgi:hypothetical protein